MGLLKEINMAAKPKKQAKQAAKMSMVAQGKEKPARKAKRTLKKKY